MAAKYRTKETSEIWSFDERMDAKEFYRLVREITEHADGDYDDAFFVEGDWQIRFAPEVESV